MKNLFADSSTLRLSLPLAVVLTLSTLPAVGATGDVDSTFNPNVTGYYVYAPAVQPDGKIVIGGYFTGVSGQPRNYIARLLADGTVESTATFNPGDGAGNAVFAVAVQADGKILLGGAFTSVNFDPRNRIARLNTNGTVESTGTFDPGTGANTSVYGTAVQADGRILLGGEFTSVNGESRTAIARLNMNGSLDPGFAPSVSGGYYSTYILSTAVQPDGKVLVGGAFTNVDGQPRNYLARLNTNGTVESTDTFNPGTGPNSGVNSIAVQADGKILLGGNFTSVNGQPRNRIARLNADGTVESTATFNPGTGANNYVISLVVQADGKILIGGAFTNVDGQSRNHVARLNTNGTVESTATFNPGTGADGDIWGLAVQADGKILLGGNFTNVNGLSRTNLARLVNDAATQALTVPSSARVQWLRGGAGPEVEQVTFELSTDGGASWSLLGPGTRIAGGWERTGLTLPGSGSIRARGRTISGQYGGSSGLVESVAAFQSAPTVTTLAASAIASTNATLNGSVNPNGATTTAWFEWGLTTNYGTVTASTNVGNGSNPVGVATNLTGLMQGTNYHFRVVASNSVGIAYGADETFSGGTHIVTTSDANGPGSLRQAIADAAPGDFITFAITNPFIVIGGSLLLDKNLSIIGTGATNLRVLGGTTQPFMFTTAPNTIVSISGLNIDCNSKQAGIAHNAVYNAGTLTLTACTFRDAGLELPPWGCIYNAPGATITLNGCTVTDSTRGGTVGGIQNAGTATLNGCTISSNNFGIRNDTNATLVLNGCTISGNKGFGIRNLKATLSLTNCTITANEALGIYDWDDGLPPGGPSSISLRNTVIAGNQGADGDVNANDPTFMPIISHGHNLIGRTHGGSGLTNGLNGDLVGSTSTPLDPLLGPLANNGGITLTHALLPGSPALEAGDDALLAPPFNLTTDQRGSPRRSGAHVDIGAFELDRSTYPSSAVTLPAAVGPNNPLTGNASVILNGSVNPSGLPNSSAFFQFGLTTSYGGVAPCPSPGYGTNPVPVSVTSPLAPGHNYHYRMVLTNYDGTFYGGDQTFSIPPLFPPGDTSGDGLVSQSELDAVLANYWPTSPWLYLTNVAGLGGTNVTFALTNSTAGAYSVEFTTNLLDWYYLGPALPRHLFTDTNAPANPQRYYRLRWP